MDKGSIKHCLRTDDGYAPESVRDYCQGTLEGIEGLRVVTSTKPPEKKRCLTTLYEQQVDGLGQLPDEPIFAVENDVLYHPSRFDIVPSNGAFYYQTNFYNLTSKGFLRHETGRCYSQLVAKNHIWKANLQARLNALKNDWHLTWAEPGQCDPPGITSNIETYRAEFPDVGIRHGKNYTGDRLSEDPDLYIDQIPYWGDYRELWEKINATKQNPRKLNIGSGCMPVSYTHLTLPTTPYV